MPLFMHGVSLRSKRFRRFFPPVRGIFRFLAARKLWRAQHSRTFLRSPQFSRVQEAKNASNLRKALRKRLLRRLARGRI